MLRIRVVALLVTVIVTTSPLAAKDFGDEIEIRGFGTWNYGETDANNYLGGNEDGSYENIEFALSVSANPYERLTIAGQIHFERGEDDEEVELDFAFAEWDFLDALRFRIGQPKQPFGIYAEIFDVGTARPFIFLPQGVYGPAGNAGESYLGLGITGSRYGDSGWSIEYDLYAGELRLPVENPFEILFAGGEVEEEEGEIEEVDDVLGGRLTVITSLEGLRFGISAYTGSEEVEKPADTNFTVMSIYLEYLTNLWSLRAEYANLQDDLFALDADSAYVEVARKFEKGWQLALRYDWYDGELEDVDVSLAPSLLEHEDWAVAVNYWFNPSFVLKLEYHLVEGNRFANPGDRLDAVLEEGKLETETDALLFGASFSF